MSARAEGFTPRSASAWATACAAALPADASQLLHEAHAAGGLIDPADAWLAAAEQKTETQARSKARRESVKGWGTGGARKDEQDEQEAQDDASTAQPALPVAGEWAFHQDPSADRATLEIRAAIEACDAVAALEALGLADMAADPGTVGRLHEEMKRWGAQADIDEADTATIAVRDGVSVRMVQLALQERREALEHGQGVLL